MEDNNIFDKFKFQDPLTVKDILAVEKLLDLAYDHKKLEIEMYWKRATYFWGFVVLSYTALFLVSSPKNSTNETNISTLNLMISSLGLVFSWGWYLVNRGSKYSTKKWQGIIDYLEDKISKPFNRLSIVDNSKLWHLSSSYKISVTKINLTISIFNVVIWTIFFISNSLITLTKMNLCTIFGIKDTYIFAATVMSIILLLFSTRDAKNKKIELRLR